MKNNIFTIMKKEFYRFFKDKRMVISTIIMPGLMIYVIYSFMGQGFSTMNHTQDDYIFTIYAENLPQSMEQAANAGMDIEVTHIEPGTKEQIIEEIKNEENDCDLLAVFPENFDESVASYNVAEGGMAPQIELYYNSTVTNSYSAYTLMTELLNQYESTMTNKFDINNEGKVYDLASEEDVTGQVFSMMIPMLMMIFLFSGCMSVAPESIAGEKERGTIATLLITPMKRSQLALGKIISLSVIAILSGLSSFLGTMLSLPNLMGGEGGMDASVYQISDYLLLLGIVLSTVLVIISFISIISAFANNVKEASTWVMPLMIVVMLIAVTSMIDSMTKTDAVWYLIPLYNSVQCMNSVFSFSANITNIIVTIASNVVYTGICVGVLTKMFNSEKVMFSK